MSAVVSPPSPPPGSAPGPAPDPGLRDPWQRHRIAPGFRQEALERGLLLRSCTSGPDPIGAHTALLAGAMGIGEQVAISEDRALRASEGSRLQALMPSTSLTIVTPGLGRALMEAYGPHPGSYLLARLPRPAGRPPWGSLRAGQRVRFHAVSPRGVYAGSSPTRIHRSLRRDARLGDPEQRPGAEGVLLSALLLSDLIASLGAWSDPMLGEPMPRSPTFEAIPTVLPRPDHDLPSGLSVLIVGGGGALAHAFLEALAVDPLLRTCLAGGRLALVDPDAFSTSNLSRQTLAGGPHRLGMPKAATTAMSLRAMPGMHAVEISGVDAAFNEAQIERFRPDVVCLFADNWAARAQAWRAVRARLGTLVLQAGTSFSFGAVRAVLVGGGRCLDCGPEGLARAAEQEAREQAARNSCSEEITPSNVLSNALAGALAAVALKRWAAGWGVDSRETFVNWSLPARIAWGRPNPPCACWRSP
ncbi:MAG: ThiF family adenylyltransferase [Pseudomonadota bacterium]